MPVVAILLLPAYQLLAGAGMGAGQEDAVLLLAGGVRVGPGEGHHPGKNQQGPLAESSQAN
jgi:hypothetical protein